MTLWLFVCFLAGLHKILEVLCGLVVSNFGHLITGCHLCVWVLVPQVATLRVCPDITLAVERDVKHQVSDFVTTYWWLNLPEKGQKMGLGPTKSPSNFESDLGHQLDTKKLSVFSHLLIIMCLGKGMHSLSALIIIIIISAIRNDLALTLLTLWVWFRYGNMWDCTFGLSRDASCLKGLLFCTRVSINTWPGWVGGAQ